MKKRLKICIISMLIVTCVLFAMGCSDSKVVEHLTTAQDYNSINQYALDFGSNKIADTDRVDEENAVKCTNGTFVGKNEKGNRVWRGIFYTDTPVGVYELKGDNQLSEYVYEALSFAKNEVNSPKEALDSRFLNVYSSRTFSNTRPVMVWIPGVGQSTSDECFWGNEFVDANQDILLVTVDYRQDHAVEDISEALHWINENVDKFGGNKLNVTLWAGDGSNDLVSQIMLENEDLLFEKAIISGSIDADKIKPLVDKTESKNVRLLMSYNDKNEVLLGTKYNRVYLYDNKYDLEGVCNNVNSETVLAFNRKALLDEKGITNQTVDDVRWTFNRMWTNFARNDEPETMEILWNRCKQNSDKKNIMMISSDGMFQQSEI